MITRRQTVIDGLLTIVFGCTAPCICASRETHKIGCVLNSADANGYLEGVNAQTFSSGTEPIPRSGNRNFDIVLAHTLANISQTFEVLPGFAYYDDYDGHNAFATPEAKLNHTDGTVLFGQGLLQNLLSGEDHPAISVSAVCAHEFGHILQFKHNLINIVNQGQATVKRSELQADYLAGYYAGVKKTQRQDFNAAVFATTQHSFGDNMKGSPGHHGTPEERAAAIVAGFKLSYNDRKNLSDALVISTAYVRGI